MKSASLICVLALALGSVVLADNARAAEACGLYDTQAVVVRQTIPYPRAVKRSPLTSDRLSTTSTRLIDARRGFRPLNAVFGTDTGYGVGIGIHPNTTGFYSDTFGVSRVSGRVFVYPCARTGVTEHRNPAHHDKKPANVSKKVSGDHVHVNPNRDLTIYKIQPRQDVTTHRNHHAEPTNETLKTGKQDLGFAKAGEAKDGVVYFSPKLPQNSGAVMVLSDGTVYTIGD